MLGWVSTPVLPGLINVHGRLHLRVSYTTVSVLVLPPSRDPRLKKVNVPPLSGESMVSTLSDGFPALPLPGCTFPCRCYSSFKVQLDPVSAPPPNKNLPPPVPQRAMLLLILNQDGASCVLCV